MVSVDEALHRLDELLEHAWNTPGDVERVPVAESLVRTLASEVKSATDLPGFVRANMDGFAVRATDTVQADEGSPAILRVVGEIRMGRPADVRVGPGEAVKISTGGMLPPGADTVVMVEDTAAGPPGMVWIYTRVKPGEHLIKADEDVKRDEPLFSAGHLIRPQDMGLLAAAGVARVAVARRPRVAILTTGDEIVAPEQEPAPGQIRDINTYTVLGMIEQFGGTPVNLGVWPDDFDRLLETAGSVIGDVEILAISGGSASGPRDYSLRLIRDLTDEFGGTGPFVDGVAVKPGMPTILAFVGSTLVVGIPGQPVSAMLMFRLFVGRAVRRWLGRPTTPAPGEMVKAVLTNTIVSAAGRDDLVRVSLESMGGTLWARPIPSLSAAISSVVKAQGLVRVPRETLRLEEGELIEVELF